MLAIALLMLVSAGGPSPAAPQPACAECHEDTGREVGASVHAELGAEACGACHGDAHAREPVAPVTEEACAACHDDAVGEYRASIHAKVGPKGDGAVCRSCHGPAHRLARHTDPRASVARKNLADTCATCHSDPEFLARHKVPIARPVEGYREGVHGRAVERGDARAATCSDCHGAHKILPARDPLAKIQRENVARTCGACHVETAAAYARSVHGQAAARGVRDAPTCSDCHGEHAILGPGDPGSPVHKTRVASVTCGHCHGDERLAARHNLAADKVPAFQDSFHGLAGRAGSQSVANCASCHGVHDILPSSDARSKVHPGNLARTCGACHPGAGERFAIGPVHVRAASGSAHPLVRFIRAAYLWLIPLTLGFMLLHHGLDFLRKLRHGPRRRFGPEVPRMGLHFRVAHALVMLSFPVLVLSGFALKYPESWWAAPWVAFEGQWGARGFMHRAAAVALLLAFGYHVSHLLLSREARRVLRALLPARRDPRDLLGMLRWNAGLRRERPRLLAVSYVEKLEYWAFVWGTVVMALSGFLLWFNTWALRHVPTWVLDAATAIHWYEAILATAAIAVWHLYTVIFDPDVYPMDRAWLTGKSHPRG